MGSPKELKQVPEIRQLPKPPVSPSNDTEVLYGDAFKNKIEDKNDNVKNKTLRKTTMGEDELPYTSSTSSEDVDDILLDIDETVGALNNGGNESIDINLAPNDEHRDSDETITSVLATPAHVQDTMATIVKAYYLKNEE